MQTLFVAQGFYTGKSAFDLYLKEISGYKILSVDEEREAGRRAQLGDEKSIEKLVKHNLRFVVSEAKKHQDRGIDLDELVLYGNEGLFIAAKKFDPDEGVRFISYAVFWVRQRVLKAISEEGTIKRPHPVSSIAKKVLREARLRAHQEGREPTQRDLETIADEMNLMGVRREAALTSFERISLDAPLYDDDPANGSIQDVYADERQQTDEQLIDADAQKKLYSAMQHFLTEREQKILSLYYGLGNEGPLTLEEIGARMGVTRERVRQLRQRSLDRLKKQSTALRELSEKER